MSPWRNGGPLAVLHTYLSILELVYDNQSLYKYLSSYGIIKAEI